MLRDSEPERSIKKLRELSRDFRVRKAALLFIASFLDRLKKLLAAIVLQVAPLSKRPTH
jgi:hypothetical protein